MGLACNTALRGTVSFTYISRNCCRYVVHEHELHGSPYCVLNVSKYEGLFMMWLGPS